MNKQELDLYLDPVNQAYFETVKGEWQEYDNYVCGGVVLVLHGHTRANEEGFNAPWIPKPIDTENPERGRWGMVDWAEDGTSKLEAQDR
jgi:hypothetical protein